MDVAAWMALDYPVKFRLACSLAEQRAGAVSEDAQLALWALQQQAMRGDNEAEQPGFWEVSLQT